MKWLSKVKELASLITAMTVVIGVLWGAFRFMNKTSGQGAALEEIREQLRSLGVEAVELVQQLHQCALNLAIGRGSFRESAASDGVDLVHEDDGGRVLPGHTHAHTRTHAHTYMHTRTQQQREPNKTANQLN